MAMMQWLAGLDVESFGLFSGVRRRRTLLLAGGQREV